MAVLRPSGVSVLVSYIIFNVLAVAAVGLRFVGIRLRRRPVKAHDYLTVLSLICTIAYSIDTLTATVDGVIGLHVDQITSISAMVITLKAFFASQWFWATGICAFRITILLLYIEIFQKVFKLTAYVCIGVVTAFWVGSITTTLAMCRPINFNWNKAIQGTCGNLGTAEMTAAAINLVLDVVIVALPLPAVWTLQMPLNKKIGVTVTFALGLSISGINLSRIILVLKCNIADFSYCTRDAAIMTVAEMAIGVIVACVPTLGAVLFPRRFGPSAQVKYNARPSDYNGSGGSRNYLRRGNNDDSFGGRSFQRLQGDTELDEVTMNETKASYRESRIDFGDKDKLEGELDPYSVTMRKDVQVVEEKSGV